MISDLEIQNFKCFENLHISFGSLTLLTGYNGGGKSSALQPLLLLAQELRRSSTPSRFALNGQLIRLGTIGDILRSNKKKSPIVFRLKHSISQATVLFETRSGERFLRLKKVSLASSSELHSKVNEGDADGSKLPIQLVETLAKTIYLSAIREGTADVFSIPDAIESNASDVGTDGRFAPYWYDQYVDNEVPEPRRHPSESATSFRKQVDAWIGTLFPGAQVNVQMMQQVSLLNLQFRLSDFSSWQRPANIGYGLTYAFPIIIALLTASEGQVVIIDSPEAHLHPSAQSKMGQLLVHFAKAGVQIMVETHSDHLLNGARLAVKEGVLPKDAVKIYFFTGASETSHGVISPSLGSDGSIDEWPEGFFDQSEKDLSRLAGWK